MRKIIWTVKTTCPNLDYFCPILSRLGSFVWTILLTLICCLWFHTQLYRLYTEIESRLTKFSSVRDRQWYHSQPSQQHQLVQRGWFAMVWICSSSIYTTNHSSLLHLSPFCYDYHYGIRLAQLRRQNPPNVIVWAIRQIFFLPKFLALQYYQFEGSKLGVLRRAWVCH